MIKKIRDDLKFNLLNHKFDFQPVFLIGCGRSGTTTLGKTLGKHSSIAYLNERRDLWHRAYPEFNIWFDHVKSPIMIAEKSDHDTAKTDVLRGLFFREQVLNKGEILLEKLPINNFRLDFLQAAFPKAKYIYLHRNGVEVAKSIERMTQKGGWFAKHKTKWDLIEKLLAASEIPIKDYSDFEKGLLEWRLSLQFSESFFSNLDESQYYSLSYQSFIENPTFQIENIFKFLNLKCLNHDLGEITKGIRRKNEKISDLNNQQLLLGGEKLKLSMLNQLRHTKPNLAIG